jgi:hypothetical protein
MFDARSRRIVGIDGLSVVFRCDGRKIPFPQALLLCHHEAVRELAMAMGTIGAVAAVAVIAALLWVLRRSARRLALLEAEKSALADQVDRLKLLERREAVCAPFDALRLCWARCRAPEEEALHAAMEAAQAARRLFPADLEPDLDEVARLLAALCRQRALQREAVLAGRHAERVAFLEEESATERLLKPKLDGLSTLLAEATRPFAMPSPGASDAHL